jgi:hypothetical protein
MIDSCTDDATHQESNVKSATDPSGSKSYESRDTSQADRFGHSAPIAGKGYVGVTRLSTCAVSGSEGRIFTSQGIKGPVQRASRTVRQ